MIVYVMYDYVCVYSASVCVCRRENENSKALLQPFRVLYCTRRETSGPNDWFRS